MAYSSTEKQPTKIKGTLTSRIEVKPSSDIPAYGFFKLDNQEQDIPVIFRIKEVNNWIKPKISKGSSYELEGYFIDNKDNQTVFSEELELNWPNHDFECEPIRVFNK